MNSASARIDVAVAPLEEILAMRDEYRREMACQIVHDSWHARGFTSSYVLQVNGQIAGYGSVGGAPSDPKDTIKEFFLRPPFRGDYLPLFRRLITASGARTIEAQTNDTLLLLLLLDCGIDLSPDKILFADGLTTEHAPPGVAFRPLPAAEHGDVFPHTHEAVGEYCIEYGGVVTGTGGYATHYNAPYADIYMEVAPPFQGRGLGSYLVQELKRACYENGRIPAARCSEGNIASRRTLERGGMFPCARIIRGAVAQSYTG